MVTPQAPAKPRRAVLKWAGGKRELLPHILPRLPEVIRTYHEPFAGGAAVFFALADTGRFRRAVLCDRNAEVIDVYRALQTCLPALLRELGRLAAGHDERQYYAVRDGDARDASLPERAARTIYLNRTGYNGLYRVNSQGRFNVPFGKRSAHGLVDEASLRAAARALRSATLQVGDFEAALAEAGEGDAAYLDPPYAPVSRTSFRAYQSSGFSEQDQARLSIAFGRLAERGVTAVLSNSDTPLTRRLYAGWQIYPVRARRLINSNAAARGAVTELLVVNSPAMVRRPSARRSAP